MVKLPRKQKTLLEMEVEIGHINDLCSAGYVVVVTGDSGDELNSVTHEVFKSFNHYAVELSGFSDMEHVGAIEKFYRRYVALLQMRDSIGTNELFRTLNPVRFQTFEVMAQVYKVPTRFIFVSDGSIYDISDNLEIAYEEFYRAYALLEKMEDDLEKRNAKKKTKN